MNRAIIFAYSHISNSRNTEDHWYALWDRVLADLVADECRLLPVPQFVLWYVESNPPDRPDREDSQDAGGDEEAGNTTIDSILSVASTVPQKSARELVPDFVVVRTMTRRNVKPRKLKYAGIPILVEVKRLPTRVEDMNHPTFVRDLSHQILLAKNGLLSQAAYLFHNFPRQKSVVLIACSGVWWSCRIVTRDDVEDASNIIPTDSDDEEDEIDVEEDGLDDSDDEALSDDELDLIGAPEGLARGESEAAIPEMEFSTILQLGTKGSDERFGLIHKRLKEVLAIPHRKTGEIG